MKNTKKMSEENPIKIIKNQENFLECHFVKKITKWSKIQNVKYFTSSQPFVNFSELLCQLPN